MPITSLIPPMKEALHATGNINNNLQQCLTAEANKINSKVSHMIFKRILTLLILLIFAILIVALLHISTVTSFIHPVKIVIAAYSTILLVLATHQSIYLDNKYRYVDNKTTIKSRQMRKFILISFIISMVIICFNIYIPHAYLHIANAFNYVLGAMYIYHTGQYIFHTNRFIKNHIDPNNEYKFRKLSLNGTQWLYFGAIRNDLPIGEIIAFRQDNPTYIYYGDGSNIKDDGQITVNNSCQITVTNGQIIRATFYMLNGNQYSGDWNNDKPHGSGNLNDEYGQYIYSGNWKDGKPHGHGVYKFPNSNTYNGDWKDGTPDGHGTFKNSEYTTQHAGLWVQGRSTTTKTTFAISSNGVLCGNHPLRGLSISSNGTLKAEEEPSE